MERGEVSVVRGAANKQNNRITGPLHPRLAGRGARHKNGGAWKNPRKPQDPVSRFRWKWRKRSPIKIMERTHEEATEALHAGRESRHPEAASAGAGSDLRVMRQAR